MPQDNEDDSKRSLQITDPSGNESDLRSCKSCGSECVRKSDQCSGETNMVDGKHLCQRHGAPNNWYESVETDKDGPVQRMLGKESGNKSFTYEDEKEVEDI